MTERENIAQGRLFTDMTEGLPEERLWGKELMRVFNGTLSSETEKRLQLVKEMFKKTGEFFWIEPPIYFAYGSHISIGENFYANCNLTIIDDWEVEIGNNVLFGPNITISTTGHPLDPEKRREGKMYAFKVIIEDDVWVGGGAIINPDVTIGRGAVIGAGSVVTKDIPANVIAVGNPCKVLRPIGPEDKLYYYKERKFSDL
ncbi:galactoside O-acetyltransferase [Hollandina sp. SP2]